MFMLIKNVEKPKLPKLIWALRKQFGPETLTATKNRDEKPGLFVKYKDQNKYE